MFESEIFSFVNGGILDLVDHSIRVDEKYIHCRGEKKEGYSNKQVLVVIGLENTPLSDSVSLN